MEQRNLPNPSVKQSRGSTNTHMHAHTTDTHKLKMNKRKQEGERGEKERDVVREKRESRGGKGLALSVSQMPRVAVCTVSPTRPSRLSRPPASLWEMYASGAGSGWLILSMGRENGTLATITALC